MGIPELIKALRRNMVETGNLVCLGCGHEHSCSTRGCAIMREAADSLERLNDFEHSQLALVRAENTTLKAELNRRAAPENKPLTLEQLRGMDGEPVYMVYAGNTYDGWRLSGDAQDYVYDVQNRGATAYARKPEAGEKG